MSLGHLFVLATLACSCSDDVWTEAVEHGAHGLISAGCSASTMSAAVCEWLASVAPDEDWLECRACGKDEWWSPATRACSPTLGCQELDALAAARDAEVVGTGGVKSVVKVRLPDAADGVFIALSTALSPDLSDFDDGIKALQDLQGRPHAARSVMPLLGHCTRGRASRMATPFFPLGSANLLADPKRGPGGVGGVDAAQSRLNAAASYLDALVVLHGAPVPRVLCDAREGPLKLLSQFLVADARGRLVLNDVDAAPALDPKCLTRDGLAGVRCGHQQFFPHEYVAPEMLWPHANEPFVDTRMPCYTEKVDIWRVPETIDFFVAGIDLVAVGVTESASRAFHRRLDALAQQCKQRDPHDRPTAVWVRRRFEEITAPLRALIGADDPAFEMPRLV
jgi:hypothetical protein